ncbi:hypothetical protein [Bacteroides sp.]|uniref:hypothetical protein n=1 Tax=Bacteroides sp. TaxID=29523 RepID=UPI00258D9233|nr:hypothetical protein [Bacteroides sp.]
MFHHLFNSDSGQHFPLFAVTAFIVFIALATLAMGLTKKSVVLKTPLLREGGVAESRGGR